MSIQKYKDGTAFIQCNGGDDLNECEAETTLYAGNRVDDPGWTMLRENDHFCPTCTQFLVADGQSPNHLPTRNGGEVTDYKVQYRCGHQVNFPWAESLALDIIKEVERLIPLTEHGECASCRDQRNRTLLEECRAINLRG